MALVFGVLVCVGLYFVAAPVWGWRPFSESAEHRRAAKRVLDALPALLEEGIALSATDPSLRDVSLFREQVDEWFARVLHRLEADLPLEAAVFASDSRQRGDSRGAQNFLARRVGVLKQIIAELETETGQT